MLSMVRLITSSSRPEIGQDGGGQAFALPYYPKEEVLRAYVVVVKSRRFFARQEHHPSHSVGELVVHQIASIKKVV